MIFIIKLSCHWPFSVSFSNKHAEEFSRNFLMCNDTIALAVNGMCASLFLCFKHFSVLISSMLDFDRAYTN